MPASQERVLTFPPGFVWGVSTSSHQFEGGLSHNSWGAWERRGRIHTGERAGRACDWWEAAERDFELARELSLGALRLSVEWSRIEPSEGDFDEAPIARYRQMLQALHDRGIEPWVCLHHFTNPLWFEARGGFEQPDSVRLFARLARFVGERLGDLCRFWVTFNEPNVYAVQGYLLGEFPPGHQGRPLALARVLGHMARAHGAAYRALKAVAPRAQVGFTQNCFALAPARPGSAVDTALASRFERLFVDGFVEMAVQGRAPALLRPLVGPLGGLPGTHDYLGLNIYGRLYLQLAPDQPRALFHKRLLPAHLPQGDLGAHGPYGEAWPGAMSYFLRRFAGLGLPLYVLENGVPDRSDRIRPWLIAHVARELHELAAGGVDVRGYFHWSLVDNFEWAEGWGLRFGLCELDPETQARRLRPSGHLYGALARHNALRAADLEQHAPGVAAEIFGGRRFSAG